MKAILYLVLVMAAVLAVTAAIIASAPYIAIILVLGIIVYFLVEYRRHIGIDGAGYLDPRNNTRRLE